MHVGNDFLPAFAKPSHNAFALHIFRVPEQITVQQFNRFPAQSPTAPIGSS
jgi:hypothetical protein